MVSGTAAHEMAVIRDDYHDGVVNIVLLCYLF